LQSDDINVMDNAAVSMAMDHHLPIKVFDLLTKGNIQKIIKGEGTGIGTLIGD